ncbi:MAG TPA: amino acid adenylation domain-containing protein [Blastocatellia bacterium]|nr:amino acid adenylation domain-containing protein [Blastocatellia bacterium]
MQKRVIEGYRLSAQQEQSWTAQDRSRPFCSQCAIVIDGNLNRGALRKALQMIVSRHEILRTTFGCLAGVDLPVQVISAAADVSYAEVSPAGENESRQRALAAMMEADRREGFDYERGPLARFKLLRQSEGENVLLVGMAALCGDGWTLKNLMSELSRCYAACLNGGPQADEPVQYVQFSEWQNELIEGEDGEAGRDYWRKQATQAKTNVRLPLERGDVQSESFSPEIIRAEVGAELGERVKSEARKIDCPLNVFFLACWQLLLRRLTRQNPVVVHSLFDGRRFKEMHDAMGPYARYLPVSSNFDDNSRFPDLAAVLQAAVSDCREWQEYFPARPADKSDSSPAPGSRVAFDFHQLPDEIEAPGVRFSMSHLYSCPDIFKLRLSVIESAGSFSCLMHYDPSVYSAASINRLAEEYLSVLASVVDDAGGLLDEVDVLGVGERDQILRQWNDTAIEYPAVSSIHEMFERQAELRPEATAVRHGEDLLTFGALNRRANQLAHLLKGSGVKAEDIVGIYMGRSAELVVAALGIMKAGAAYLPIDVTQPARRVALVLEDANVSLVVTQGVLAQGARDEFKETEFVEVDCLEMADQSEENPDNHTSPENLAYVIYTSGSTGTPKGVTIQHRSVVNLVNALKEIYGGGQEYRTLSVNAPLAFDGSVKQLMQIANGHSLSIVPEDVRRDGEAMLGYLEEACVDVLDCTPGQLNLLLRAGLEGGDGCRPGKVMVGGEAIDARVWRLLAESDRRQYYNLYGPTECTVDATVCQITSPNGGPHIGRPIANARVYILDERERIVPIGVAGEIHVGGAGVGRGYLRRADLTAEKFIPDDFGGRAGARLYKTGDRGRFLEDGTIEYIERNDHQVKVRGYRVELGEIEAVLEQHPGVEKAVVVAREDQAGDQRLIAYALVSRRHLSTVDGKPRYKLPNGMAIAQQNKNETDYLYDEIFNKQTYFKHGISVPENACVFDVGANIGLFTLFVSQQFASARVYAFEPIKDIFDTLRINTELYKGEVKLFQLGLSDEEKTDRFAYYPEYSMMSGLKAYSDAGGDVEVIKRYLSNEIETGRAGSEMLLDEAEEILAGRFDEEVVGAKLVRLSDVIRQERVERIDLLKVDVQRAEMDVLRGIDEKDWGKIQQVVMEAHDGTGTESEGRVEQIIGLLDRHGFKTVVEQDELLSGTDRFNIYAVRRAQSTQSGNGRAPAQAGPVAARNVEERMLTVEDLRDYLRQRLPDYMVPSSLLIMGDLPLTRNGKVDREALPVPEQGGDDSSRQAAAPFTPFEEMLAAIWCEVLNIDKVSAGDHFFNLGGHSLLATQLVSRIREVFKVDVPLRIVFETPRLDGLAKAIREAKSAKVGIVAPPLRRVGRDKQIPLSFAQQRLWFLNQLEPESAFYNCASATRFRGLLKVNELERTVNEIARRHEVVRTTFSMEQPALSQVIHPPSPQVLPVVDLSDVSERGREAEARLLTAEEAQRPFDLSEGPLFRVKLLKMAEDDHILLSTMHHIVADGWSMGILLREVQALYESFSKGEASPLAEPDIQYADYACWQREWLQGEVLEQQISYWKTKLADSESLLELPTDRPRPPVLTFRGASLPVALSETLTDQLKTLSRNNGATLFMVMLAAYQALLSRYTGRQEIVVGSPIAGRNRVELENLIGFFINTLALRADLSGKPSFRELLGRVRQVALEAYTYQDLPFEKLVEELNPERSLSHTPLFQVAFGLQHSSGEEFQLPGLDLSSAEAQGLTAKFDLVLTMVETGQRLTGSLRYNTDLFDFTTAARMLGHFETMLKGIVGNPDESIALLPILTEAELHQMLIEWNDTAVEYPESRLMHEIFEEQVGRNPSAIAAIFEDDELTYDQLNRRANQLAHHLRSMGIGPDSPVGIYMERSLDLIVGLLGILKAGGAYVPLDPAYPLERLAFMLEDTLAAVVLTQQRLLDSLPSHRGEVVCVDTEWEKIAMHSEEGVSREAAEENIAYVIYTSGSTGKPKGVMLTHRGTSNVAEAHARSFNFQPTDRILQFSSLNFDASVFELTMTFRGGAALVFAKQERLLPGHGLISLMREKAVTGTLLPPSVLAAMPEAELPDMKTIIVAGEACSAQLVAQWGAGRRFFNAYGPTEVTIWGTLARCMDGKHKPLIGTPILNMQVYLLDENLQLVPVGVSGEIHIAGVGLARGYINRPDLTAEKFIPNPFGIEPGTRLYKTGDQARRLPDGTLDFLGRLDYQVKIRGYRIELEEIGSVLSKHSAVIDNVVIARKDSNGENTLVAFLVCDEEVARSASVFRSFLKTHLPEYMIPSTFVFLDALPLLPNGKIDRKALLSIDRDRSGLDEPFVEPRTELERFLAEKWREILDLQTVGAADNFFELGGDSIKAAVFVNMLQEQLGEIVHIVSIFDSPSIAAYASYLKDHYPNSIARLRRTGTSPEAGFHAEAASHAGDRISPADVAHMRQLIKPLRPRHGAKASARNSPVVFVLSPPRSGSTLLRVMLGGHSRLFAPPELELLSFNTLEERKESLSGRASFWLEGTVRAIMQIKGCDADRAKEIMREYENRQLTTKEFYSHLQEWIGEKTLVDKSPSYSLDLEILKRAEADFENPLYIHLVRGPYATIRSYEEARIGQIYPRFEHPFSERQVAELVWLISHQNILQFLEGVPPHRHHRVKFEEIVGTPERALGGMCEFLGIEFQPGMMEPYKEKQARMTDGIYEQSHMLGDIKFHDHKSIEADVANRWKTYYRKSFLAEPSLELADRLGYDRSEFEGVFQPPDRAPLKRIDAFSFDSESDQISSNLDRLTEEELDALIRNELSGGQPE